MLTKVRVLAVAVTMAAGVLGTTPQATLAFDLCTNEELNAAYCGSGEPCDFQNGTQWCTGPGWCYITYPGGQRTVNYTEPVCEDSFGPEPCIPASPCG
jgi:hypothetical protein